MVFIKSEKEIEGIRKACRISAGALKAAGEAVKPGISTAEIDKIAHDYVIAHGAVPNFLNYNDFPASACISVNEEVIHGIPSKDKILKEGGIVSIDMGAAIDGFHGDNAATFPVGKISDEAMRLIETTRESFYEGMKYVRDGSRLGDVGYHIQKYCEERGYGVVREFTGHGCGKALHEDPSIPNYGRPGKGMRLMKGMTLAIEPMITEGKPDIDILDDCWTIVTLDGKLAAHYEHTILVTEDGYEILTVCDE